MNRTALLYVLLASFLAFTCAKPGPDKEINSWYKTTGVNLIPKTEKKGVLRALRKAGDNWHQLAASLEEVKPDYRPGMIFLVVNMPEHDLVAIRSDILVEYVEYAYIAREKMPWGKDIPEDIFQTEVLPYRSTSEPIEKWRKDFFERLYPVVHDCETSGEAALRVNQWAASQVTYKPSTLVQGPYEMLKSGYGRCGELTNFLVEAARSVCIPARSAYTPWWPMRDDNHAWLEIWDTGDRDWHFVGAAEPTPLDHGWFDSIVKKTGKVYAVKFRPSGASMRGRLHERKDLEDVTESYVDSIGTVKVKVTENGRAVAGTQVRLSVWNFSSLRPTASGTTDKTGVTEIKIGAGTYLVTAGKWEKNTWQLVTVGANKVKEVVLELTDQKTEEVVKMQ